VTPLYPQKLALTSPTGGGRSVGIVRVRTKATGFVCFSLLGLLALRVASSSEVQPVRSFFALVFVREQCLYVRKEIHVAFYMNCRLCLTTLKQNQTPCTAVMSKLLAREGCVERSVYRFTF